MLDLLIDRIDRTRGLVQSAILNRVQPSERELGMFEEIWRKLQEIER